MSCTDYYAAPQQSPAQRERTERGRRRVTSQLQKAAGVGSTVSLDDDEMRDVQSGARFDHFTLVSSGGHFSPSCRRAIEAIANDTQWYGVDTVHVDIDQRRYDTRWMAFDFTSEQRTTACLVLLGIVLLISALCYVEHYRTEHIGGSPLHHESL